MDDQFATAEARCDDLQEKIDLIKSLKRKRKLKKRRYSRLEVYLNVSMYKSTISYNYFFFQA